MPEEKPPQTPVNKPVQYVRPPEGVPSFYTNNVAIGPTNFDIRIVFGELMEPSEEQLIVTQRVSVTMSWLEAKILATFLQDNVDAFEKANGAITFPQLIQPEMTNPFTTPKEKKQ